MTLFLIEFGQMITIPEVMVQNQTVQPQNRGADSRLTIQATPPNPKLPPPPPSQTEPARLRERPEAQEEGERPSSRAALRQQALKRLERLLLLLRDRRGHLGLGGGEGTRPLCRGGGAGRRGGGIL